MVELSIQMAGMIGCVAWKESRIDSFPKKWKKSVLTLSVRKRDHIITTFRDQKSLFYGERNVPVIAADGNRNTFTGQQIARLPIFLVLHPQI